MHKLLIAASVAALAALPSLAQPTQPTPPTPPAAPHAHAMHMKHGGWDEAKTRADVEKKIAERFGEADANKDGAVTQAELDAHIEARVAEARKKMAEVHGKMFDRLDTDKNGAISRQEWEAHHSAMTDKFEKRIETSEKDGKHEKRVMMFRGGEHDGHGGHDGKRMWHHRADKWGKAWFEKADANKDGRVTLAEARAKPLEHFDEADANKDGTLTPEERRSAHEKMREEWKSKRGG